MSSVAILLKTFRLPFLVLTPACVFLGAGLAVWQGADFSTTRLMLVLIGALSAHISVNALNEYHDFMSGLDFKTERTPFSGGSGALISSPQLALPTLLCGSVAIFLTILIGLFLVKMVGVALLTFGVVGVLLVITYTNWLNRQAILCLLSSGTGFGLLMSLGSYFVLAERIEPVAVALSLLPFFLVNNLLLLNQYPDVDADRSVGRQTFPIVYGFTISNLVYGLFLLVSFSLLVGLVLFEHLPAFALMGLLPMLFGFVALIGVSKFAKNIKEYPQYLAANVVAAVLTPLVIAVALFIA